MDRAQGVVVALEQAHETVEFAEGQVHRPPAAFADDMVVLPFDEVDNPGAMAEVDVLEMARLFEDIDGAIDRRRIDWGAGQLLNALVQIGSAEMIVVRLGQDPAHRSPGAGDAQSGCSQ